MKISRTTNAERAGRWFGRAWRGFVRPEARAVQWLAGKGLPAGVARLLPWIVKLTRSRIHLYVRVLYSLDAVADAPLRRERPASAGFTAEGVIAGYPDCRYRFAIKS